MDVEGRAAHSLPPAAWLTVGWGRWGGGGGLLSPGHSRGGGLAGWVGGLLTKASRSGLRGRLRPGLNGLDLLNPSKWSK